MTANEPVVFVARKALFSFLGNTFRITDASGSLRYFVKQQAFRLREKIDVFADEARTVHVIQINARSISDMRGRYDIVDAQTGATVGGAKRNALKSMLSDEWDLFDAEGHVVGRVKERRSALSFLRKFLKIIPQTYDLYSGGSPSGEIKQRFSLFRLIYDVRIEPALDERLGVAATVLLLAIESGRD